MHILLKAIEEEISKRENSCERGATSHFQFHKDVVSFSVPESSNGWNMVAINPLKVVLYLHSQINFFDTNFIVAIFRCSRRMSIVILVKFSCVHVKMPR